MFVMPLERLNWKPLMVNTTFKGCYFIKKNPLPSCFQNSDFTTELTKTNRFTSPSWEGQALLWAGLSHRRCHFLGAEPLAGALQEAAIAAPHTEVHAQPCSQGTAQPGQRAARQSQSYKLRGKRPWRGYRMIHKDFVSPLVAAGERNLKRYPFFGW